MGLKSRRHHKHGRSAMMVKLFISTGAALNKPKPSLRFICVKGRLAFTLTQAQTRIVHFHNRGH